MFLLDGKRLTPGVAFTHGNIQYPANWLNHTSLQEKEAIGITEVAEESRPDDEYYWVTDNGNGTFSSTAKSLDDVTETYEGKEYTTKGLKSNKVAQIKSTTNSLLAKTDWMVIRKAERDIDIPANTVTFRAAVITESNRLETAINAATTVEELITAVQSANWPQE